MSRSRRLVGLALVGLEKEDARRATNCSRKKRKAAESPCPPVDEHAFRDFRQTLAHTSFRPPNSVASNIKDQDDVLKRDRGRSFISNPVPGPNQVNPELCNSEKAVNSTDQPAHSQPSVCFPFDVSGDTDISDRNKGTCSNRNPAAGTKRLLFPELCNSDKAGNNVDQLAIPLSPAPGVKQVLSPEPTNSDQGEEDAHQLLFSLPPGDFSANISEVDIPERDKGTTNPNPATGQKQVVSPKLPSSDKTVNSTDQPAHSLPSVYFPFDVSGDTDISDRNKGTCSNRNPAAGPKRLLFPELCNSDNAGNNVDQLAIPLSPAPGVKQVLSPEPTNSDQAEKDTHQLLFSLPLDSPVIEISNCHSNPSSSTVDDIDLTYVVVQPNVLTEGRLLYTEPLPVTDNNDGSNISDVSSNVSNVGSSTTTPSSSLKRRRTPGSSGSPTRKRSKNEAVWKKNVNKALKNSGQPYTTAKGTLHKGAQMRDPCACTFDCRHRLKEENRCRIHKTFWQIGNHNRQWEFIRLNSSVTATKPRHGDTEQILKRSVSRSYSFTVDGVQVKVCKQMFMRTLGICDSWIESAYKHVNPDKGNTISPDKRGGKRGSATKVTEAKIATVTEHINLFPRVPSHYCRKRSKREYLEKGLSIAKMARLYQKWAVEKGLPMSSIASQRQYRTILNAKFNIGFFKPKKDQCSLCLMMRNKHNTRQIREEKKNAYAAHIKNKQKARALKDKDVAESLKDKNVVVCSFDLQKQLSCPKSEDGAYYYRSKLNVYNFTVFNMSERIGDCYLWHEGIGKKGSNEISSSLLHYIKHLVSQKYTDIRFYSDNCAGQNKNRFLFAMYEYAAVKYGIKITHRYLEPGHTQMECDSIHARIERVTEKEDIYDFDGWVDFIKKAKQELPMYQVKQLDQNCIFSFKKLVQMQNWDVDLKRQPMTWKKVRELQIDGRQGNLVRVKYDLHHENFVTMSPNKVGRCVNLKTFLPPLAYEEKISLSENTIKDLKWLCDNNHVPVGKQAFLRSVIAGVSPVVEENISDVEYESDEELCHKDLEEEGVEAAEGSNSEEEDNVEED